MSPIFEIIDSVQIDNLKNVFLMLIVLIKWKLITCQMFFFFDIINLVRIDNFTNFCSILIFSDKEEKK